MNCEIKAHSVCSRKFFCWSAAWVLSDTMTVQTFLMAIKAIRQLNPLWAQFLQNALILIMFLALQSLERVKKDAETICSWYLLRLRNTDFTTGSDDQKEKETCFFTVVDSKKKSKENWFYLFCIKKSISLILKISKTMFSFISDWKQSTSWCLIIPLQAVYFKLLNSIL